MAAVTELDIPEFEFLDPTLSGERYHELFKDLAEKSWVARAEIGYFVLDREAGELFLRTRAARFPGLEIAEMFGVDEGPLAEEMRRNILHLDDEDHRRLRQLVNPFFTPRAADRWRPAMRGFLEQLWEPLATAGSCEAVEQLCKPYPSLTIATVMGAPLEDAPKLHEWSNWIQKQFDGPTLMTERAAAAVQEVVRFEPITPFTARIMREDLEVRGVTFPAGTIVMVAAVTANRDGVGDGETFDIAAERDRARVLTFGAGPHYCLGVNLARAELQEALAFLAPRMPGLALDGEPELEAVHGIYGVGRLPVRWAA